MLARMLPEGSSESRALAEILSALSPQRQSLAAPSLEPPQPAAEEPEDDFFNEEAGCSARLDVLAVEDNAVNRMVLEQMLSSLSVTFRLAATAAEGLADYAEHAPRRRVDRSRIRVQHGRRCLARGEHVNGCCRLQGRQDIRIAQRPLHQQSGIHRVEGGANDCREVVSEGRRRGQLT